MKQDVDFSFDVGETEKHHVAVGWRQMWGRFKLEIDGKTVINLAVSPRHLTGPKATRRL